MRLGISWVTGDGLCRGLRDVMIISWAYGYRLCWRFFDFMIVCRDHPHRHMEIVFVGIWTSRIPMGNDILIYFKKYPLYTFERVVGI